MSSYFPVSSLSSSSMLQRILVMAGQVNHSWHSWNVQ
jgi:hypothetical protein